MTQENKHINHFYYYLTVGVLCLAGFAGAFLDLGSHTLVWLNLLIRWAHVMIGIIWIGTSFYFIFLENNLRSDPAKPELAGSLWAVHGGGFYYVEKYKSAPDKMPEKLHWFRYESYFTWITGFLLLLIVYYANPGQYLIDQDIAALSSWQAVALSLISIFLAWFIYDLLCRYLLQQPYLFLVLGLLTFIGFAWFYASVFSGRGAYMHMGVLLGTLMVGNVFRVIIPSQQAVVKALTAGRPVNPALGRHAGARSLHNNYFTLPVVFVMISNHFPVMFESSYNWVLLLVLIFSSAALRHFINLKERGIERSWILPLATLGILVLAYVTAPLYLLEEKSAHQQVSLDQVNEIVRKRCVSCHSSSPSDEVWKAAPSGMKFDTEEQIVANATKIMERVVSTNSMPLGNKTGMTTEERQVIANWVLAGREI